MITSVEGATAQSTGGTVQLNEIVVQGKGNPQGNDSQNAALASGPTGVIGYTAENVSAATKTTTPLVKIPASVSVVTRENLDDRNVQTLNDALAYTPGAEVNVFGYDPRFDSIYIRGFDTTYDGVYRDGLRLANAAGAGAVFHNEPYDFDAITVLRGPSAATYGFGSPGGIIDITSKRPTFSQFGEIDLQFGNFARKQGNFDIGGPVAGTNDTLAYRLTGVFRDANAFPTGPDDRVEIAPAFTYRPDGSTTFTFLSSYMKTELPGSVAFYNFRDGPNYIVTNIKYGDPAFNTDPQEQFRVGYAFEHEFSSDLIVRQNVRYSGLDFDYKYTTVDSITPVAASRSDGQLFEKLTNFAVDNQVEKHVDLGPVKNVLLAGLDYSHSNFDNRYGFGTAPDLNLVTLNYGQQYIAPPAITNGVGQVQDQLGVYLQDQLEWNRFTLTLSGRHDSVTTSTMDSPGTETDQANNAFTGRAGLNYKIIDGVYPYVSYATTFIPNLGTGADGQPFAPTRGDQKEAGVKTQIPTTNLHINGAVFDITESNILRTDPDSMAFSVATGRVRSQGYEVEAIDNIAPGTNLVASYTHVDLRFLDDTLAAAGNRLSGIPGDTFAAFAKYRLQTAGVLGGLSVGGGIRYAGWSFADDANTAINRPYALFDAVIGYDFAALDSRLKGFYTQLNANNVFNRYATTCEEGFCYRIQPATVIGSLIYRW